MSDYIIIGLLALCTVIGIIAVILLFSLKKGRDNQELLNSVGLITDRVNNMSSDIQNNFALNRREMTEGIKAQREEIKNSLDGMNEKMQTMNELSLKS